MIRDTHIYRENLILRTFNTDFDKDCGFNI